MSLHRTPLGVACIVLGALELLVGALLSDAARLLRPDAFADRVAASLADERVAAVAAEQLTDAVIAQRRDLTAVRPLILAASRDVVGSSVFRGVARTAARRAHSALFSPVGQSVALSIPDLEVVLRATLAGSPTVVGSLPKGIVVGLTDATAHPGARVALRVMRAGLTLARYAWLALAAGALLLAGGVLLMRDRRDALVGAGAALIAVGVGLWATLPVGEAIVTRLVDAPRTSGALAALWSVALAGVPRWGLMYGGIGVVLAAAGSSLLERLDVRELGHRLARLFIEVPSRPWVRLARGLAIGMIGGLAVLAPQTALAVLTVAAGLLVAFVGLREVFAVVLHSAPPHARLGRALAASGEGWAVGGVLVVLLAALFASAIAVVNRSGADGRAPTTIDACNGDATLCDRRLDEVVLAGTHNAMASADVADWMFPQQEHDIVTQLHDGIRALLIDVHYGTPVGARVRTDLSGGRRADAERMLGPEGTAAAMRIRDRLVGGQEGARGLYLCHGYCELGALPVDGTFGAIRDFLMQHPNEVVVLVIEDYVAPQDLARAFERSGLADLVYRGRPGAGWPTLRELIARDERVVALIESGRSGVRWLLPAFSVLQETPYAFASAGDTLSCAPNRGAAVGTLFQLNHWIATAPAPRPSNAAIVNAFEVLTERARRCERARGRRPNILAVDFYRTGAVLRAARALNGLEDRPSPGDSVLR
ncbi:MAG: hypothetical protein ACXWZ4_15285 [Gemmatirosa sp.]